MRRERILMKSLVIDILKNFIVFVGVIEVIPYLLGNGFQKEKFIYRILAILAFSILIAIRRKYKK